MAKKWTEIYADNPAKAWNLTDIMVKSTDMGGGNFTSEGFLFSDLIAEIPTLYTADGTLAGTRIVDLDSNFLIFDNGDVGIGEGVVAARLDIKGADSVSATRNVRLRRANGDTIMSIFNNGQAVMDRATLTSNATLQIADNGERSLLVLGDATGTDHWMLAIAAPGGTGMVMLADEGDLSTGVKLLSILNQSGCEMKLRAPDNSLSVLISSVVGQNRLDCTSDDGTQATMRVTFDKKIGVFNAAPVVQPAAANQAALTNNTGGAYDGTLVDVTTTGLADPAKINANFTDVHTLLNEIRTALVNLGFIKGAA